MLTEGEEQKSVRNSKTGDFGKVMVLKPLSVHRVAEWLGDSPQNVQSIESGRGKLTRENAELISNQTAANIGWLLAGNPANPVDWYNNPYTPAAFKQRQAELTQRKNDRKLAALLTQTHFAKATAMIAAILRRAFQNGKEDIGALRLIEALRPLYSGAIETRQDPNNFVASFIACRHTIIRPDLKPILDTWEAHFQKMLPQGPQPKARPAKPTGKTAKHPASTTGSLPMKRRCPK